MQIVSPARKKEDFGLREERRRSGVGLGCMRVVRAWILGLGVKACGDLVLRVQGPRAAMRRAVSIFIRVKNYEQ